MAKLSSGYLALILHAHLPYVRHPHEERFLEEKWFYEALTETYLPLMLHLRRLIADDLDFEITLSLSPTLLGMMTDPLLKQRYDNYLANLIELAEKEIQRTQGDPQFEPLAHMYRTKLQEIRDEYEDWDRDLIRAIKSLNDSGRVDLMTTTATHAYLPLHQINPQNVRAQIETGLSEFERHFGFRPRGFWLPECGYYPGVEDMLSDVGIQYFILESHGILHASPRPRYGLYAPIYCPGGVAGFGRDIESSKQVWSSNEGYPGDYNYREFYRDIGHDLSEEELSPFINPGGPRTHTGLKYFKITGQKTPLEDKDPYIPHLAQEKAADHAGNFMFNRIQQIQYLNQIMDRKPIIVCPYDAELFGHWWFEGPDWLNYLIRKVDQNKDQIRLISPGTYLDQYPINQVTSPPMSSWGYRGYNDVWLEGSNDWIYPHLHKAADRMIELAVEYDQYVAGEGDDLKAALDQAARELLLAQSSDWPFIMKTDTMVEYAHERFTGHIANFTELYEQITENRIDKNFLDHLQSINNPFPELNYRAYLPEPERARREKEPVTV